jgi:hypothetical protein
LYFSAFYADARGDGIYMQVGSAVPEPGTLALVLSGLGIAVTRVRARRPQ